jgi:hypothetical protein
MSRHRGRIMAGTLFAVLGTLACQISPRLDRSLPSDQAAPRHTLRLFSDQAGTARIDIGWSDRRQEARAVQAFSDAASFSAVVFTLSNAARFRQARARAFLLGDMAGATVADAFTSLPSDPVANYVLSAILFRGVATDSLTAAEYQNRDNIVGVGVSAAFSLAPGENRRVPILIHAVPPLAVDTRSNYVVDRLVPTLVEGDPRAYAELMLREQDNPLADRLRIRFFENGTSTLLGTREYLKSATESHDPSSQSQTSQQASTLDDYAHQVVLIGDAVQKPQAPDTARFPLSLPAVPEGRVTLSTFMQVEMASGDLVLSRRGMNVILEKGGRVDVSVDASPSAEPSVSPTQAPTSPPA